MILLESNNRIIEELFTEFRNKAANAKANGEEFKRQPIDVVFSDFDGVQFHVSTPNQDNFGIVNLSIQWRCYPALKKHGAEEALKKHYGSFLQSSPEPGYAVTLQVDVDAATDPNLPQSLAAIKRNIFAAPFDKAFDNLGSNDLYEIDYRDNEELYIKPGADSVTVIFSIHFEDAGDAVFAKVFLQEFADARKSMNNVPAVRYSQKDPPEELKNVQSAQRLEHFVSFVLFKGHFDAKHRENTISTIQTFRNYLQYHIKCSKAFMHQCMRLRVDSFIQVLNRAKIEQGEKEKKTAAGKTFVRK